MSFDEILSILVRLSSHYRPFKPYVGHLLWLLNQILFSHISQQAHLYNTGTCSVTIFDKQRDGTWTPDVLSYLQDKKV